MKVLRRLLPSTGGVVLVALLASQIELNDVLDMLVNAAPGWLLVGCGWYLLTNLLRAVRFGVLLEPADSWIAGRILPEMFALSFLNNVLPSRTGELSFPYFMQRRHQVIVGESASALLIARVFDYLAVIALYLIFALLELPNLQERAAAVIAWVIGLSALSIALLALAPWMSGMLLRFIEDGLSRLNWRDRKWMQLLLRFGHDVVEALLRTRRLSLYLRTFGWSVLIWLTTFAWFSALLRSIGISVRYTLVVVGATFASLAKAIPFITVGGFGAHEAGWTLGFSLTGMDRSLAISSGFAVNVLTLTMSVLFGGLSLLFISFARR